MHGQNILVLGGTGFIGTHLVSRLVAQGARVTLVTRRRRHARELLLLPLVTVIEADILEEQSLNQVLPGHDTVINLLGILHDTGTQAKGFSYGKLFHQVHVDLVQRLLKGCKQYGVRRLLHMSALGADSQGPSQYQRSKGDAEAILNQASRDNSAIRITIFRPSVVFGPEDQFMNLFASLTRWLFILPLAASQSLLQPVYVGDVVQAFINALNHPLTYGKTYDLVGPQVYSLAQLVNKAAYWSGHFCQVVPLPFFLGKIQAGILERLPGGPVMSRDNLDSLRVNNTSTQGFPEELGIKPTALEAIAPEYLSPPASPYDKVREHAGR